MFMSSLTDPYLEKVIQGGMVFVYCVFVNHEFLLGLVVSGGMGWNGIRWSRMA